jgi:hypothetical protein
VLSTGVPIAAALVHAMSETCNAQAARHRDNWKIGRRGYGGCRGTSAAMYLTVTITA